MNNPTLTAGTVSVTITTDYDGTPRVHVTTDDDNGAALVLNREPITDGDGVPEADDIAAALAADYHDGGGCLPRDVIGFTPFAGVRVNLVHDEGTDDAWRSGDYCPPALEFFSMGHMGGHWNHHGDESLEEFPPAITSTDNWRTFADLCGGKNKTLLRWIGNERYSGDLLQAINERITESFRELVPTDRATLYAAASTAAGVPAFAVDMNDRSIVYIYTPEFVAKTGATPNQDDADAFGREYQNWLHGDVYGYSIDTDAGDVLDSCYGFNGRDCATSGLWDAAAESLVHILNAQQTGVTP